MSTQNWMRSTRIAAPAFLFLLLSPLGTARAAAPQVKSQAPGYYRMMLGDFEITALSDATFKTSKMG